MEKEVCDETEAIAAVEGAIAVEDDRAMRKVANEILAEAERAVSLNPPLHSPHEALGVIREEYIEFEDEVFAFNLRKGRDTRPQMRAELIQLAAMALRAIVDCGL